MLPAGIFLYGYYARSADILRSEVIRTTQQALKQAGSNLSYRLERIEDISDAAFMNANLHSYLSINSDDQSIGTQIKVIEDLRYLVDTVQSNSDVFHVRVFVDKSKLYAEERINFFTLDSLMVRPWFRSIIDGNGGSYGRASTRSRISAAPMRRYYLLPVCCGIPMIMTKCPVCS